jgi:hypothetical protein
MLGFMHQSPWVISKVAYGFDALRACNNQRVLIPQTHSLDGDSNASKVPDMDYPKKSSAIGFVQVG